MLIIASAAKDTACRPDEQKRVSLISVLEYLDEDSPESIILESVLEAMAGMELWLMLVEAGGIELPSERKTSPVSPSAVPDLSFAFQTPEDGLRPASLNYFPL